MKNGFRAFDSDMHVYDAAFLYEKYMNPKWGERIPRGQRNGKHGRVEFKLAGGKETLRAITRKLKHVNKALREDPKANALFLDMLTSEKDPETTLRRLNEAGVFGRFLPDFGRVVAQMQYNMYHHYTVDEHTIFAIGILHAIEQGRLAEAAPIASEVVHKILSRRVLYMAVLLHDIAKGRNGDHSELGAKVAEKVEGPFGEELTLTLREVSMGKLRRDALKELSERTGVPDLVSFINAVVQAETMGTSIAAVLRVQAEQMRTRRRQRAEQAAYQAPIKMIFPLVLCIFPTLFIVILGPAAINIYQTLIQREP